MKQNNYTINDIERYHSGGMPAAEMHTLEKAALDDPFLADALEGYAFTQTASTDLASLQQRLNNRIQKEEEKKPSFFIDSNWMKIAALFILFAGGGWLVFQMLSHKKTELATAPVLEKQTPTTVTKEDRADSTEVYSDAPINNQTVSTQSDQQKDRSVQNNITVPVTSPTERDFQLPPTFSRQLTDSSRSRAYAHVEVMAPQKEKASDSFSFKSNANGLTKQDKFASIVPGIKTDTIKNVDVVLQQSEMALDEVVVVNKNRTVAKQDAKRRMQVTVDTLEPAEGWTNFGDYIATNMRSQDELKAKPVNGEVELSFEVNKQGEPVNITIVRSLCEKCDEEAVRLLKEGPKWKKNKKRGTVRFSF